MMMRSRLVLPATLCAGGIVLPGLAAAQAFDQYLSPTVPGYDTVRGVQVLQRPRTEYDPLGVRVGEFIIRPQLDESVSYDSNVLGTRPSIGSWAVNTAPQMAFNSDFGTNSIGGTLGLTDVRYLDQKAESHTDWNASLGGMYQIGQDKLTISASEIYAHENPTDINSATLTQPLGFKVTDFRASYATRFNYWQLEPNVEYIGYRFDPQTLAGATLSQKVRDRDQFIGGLTTRFGEIPERSAVLVLRTISTHYVASLFDPTPGAANGGVTARPDAIGYEALAGIDYAFSANLQVLFLVGYELGYFHNRNYSNQSSPVLQAGVVWAPSGLTTVTAKAIRSIEASVGENTTGATVTQGSLTIDHEYLRNWLLQGRLSGINTTYTNGGTYQTLISAGGSLSYLFNRNMRLSLSYDFTNSSGNATNQVTIVGAAAGFNNLVGSSTYNRHVVLVGLRFTL